MRLLVVYFLSVFTITLSYAQSVKDYLIKNNRIENTNQEFKDYLQEIDSIDYCLDIYADTNNYILGVFSSSTPNGEEDKIADKKVFIFNTKDKELYLFEFYPDWEGVDFLQRLDKVFMIYKVNAKHKLDYIVRINIFKDGDYIFSEVIEEDDTVFVRSIRDENKINLNEILTNQSFSEITSIINSFSFHSLENENMEKLDLSELKTISKFVNY